MPPNVQNLKLTEVGDEYVAEADFLAHHITVRCVYDAGHSCWIPAVFLSTAPDKTQLTSFTMRLRAASRLGAVHLGIHFAIAQLMLDDKAPIPSPADATVLIEMCSGLERAQQDNLPPLS